MILHPVDETALLAAMLDYQREHGRPATMRDLLRATGISSLSVVGLHLEKLKRAGRVKRISQRRYDNRAYVAIEPERTRTPSQVPASEWPIGATSAWDEPGRLVFEYD